MAAPELDLQRVASSAEEGKTTPVHVQTHEGAPESKQGKAANALHSLSRCFFHV